MLTSLHTLSPRAAGKPLLVALLVQSFAAAGCGASEEATLVPLDVVVTTAHMGEEISEAGYAVTLTEARAALRDLEFTVGGETHEGRVAALLGALSRALVPSAHAHPGHAAGGDVTGALSGPLMVDFLSDGAPLGTAELLEGDYHGANFTFRTASADDGLEPDDPMLGHTFSLRGTAQRDDQAFTFDCLVDIDDGSTLVGAPFVLAVRQGESATLGLALVSRDAADGTTLWDDIDFAALDLDGDGAVSIRLGEPAHNVLRRALQVHVFYQVDALSFPSPTPSLASPL